MARFSVEEMVTGREQEVGFVVLGGKEIDLKVSTNKFVRRDSYNVDEIAACMAANINPILAMLNGEEDANQTFLLTSDLLDRIETGKENHYRTFSYNGNVVRMFNEFGSNSWRNVTRNQNCCYSFYPVMDRQGKVSITVEMLVNVKARKQSYSRNNRIAS